VKRKNYVPPHYAVSSSFPSLSEKDQVIHSYKTTDKITILKSNMAAYNYDYL